MKQSDQEIMITAALLMARNMALTAIQTLIGQDVV